MQVFRGVPTLSASPCVLTIGNFDGVHLGHKALLARLCERARALGLPAAVLTFEPLPREFFAPDTAPPRLAGLRHKLELLAKTGVDHVYVQRFDERFASMDAETFIDRVLVRGLHTRYLLIGDDFRFGRGRLGDFTTLQAAGPLRGFQVEAMHTLEVQRERASSSAVREALQAGQIEHATRLIGEPFTLSGRVLHGDKIGRTLGFPTANIQLRQPSLPLSGIFAVTVSGGPLKNAQGAASVGVRPTIGDKLGLRLEAFVFDFDGDLYHQRLCLGFHHKIRDEAKYDSFEALRTAIEKDCAEARAYFTAKGAKEREGPQRDS